MALAFNESRMSRFWGCCKSATDNGCPRLGLASNLTPGMARAKIWPTVSRRVARLNTSVRFGGRGPRVHSTHSGIRCLPANKLVCKSHVCTKLYYTLPQVGDGRQIHRRQHIPMSCWSVITHRLTTTFGKMNYTGLVC